MKSTAVMKKMLKSKLELREMQIKIIVKTASCSQGLQNKTARILTAAGDAEKNVF